MSVSDRIVSGDIRVIAVYSAETSKQKLKDTFFNLSASARRRNGPCLFRGVHLPRLLSVLSSGIDVSPPDATFFATYDYDKAHEYGRIILAIDHTAAERSFKEIDSSTLSEEIEKLKKIYPTVIPSNDGTTIWLSKLPSDDRRIATPYEGEYCYWMPKNQDLALKEIHIWLERDNVGGGRAQGQNGETIAEFKGEEAIYFLDQIFRKSTTPARPE